MIQEILIVDSLEGKVFVFWGASTKYTIVILIEFSNISTILIDHYYFNSYCNLSNQLQFL